MHAHRMIEEMTTHGAPVRGVSEHDYQPQVVVNLVLAFQG